MAGEELRDWQFQYLDLPYSRYRNDDGYQVFRYAFPETEENVAVGAYSYDQANKSFLLGLGMNVEVWGLKKSVLACPELADYIGGIVRIRRSHPDYLLNGRFRDTLGARSRATCATASTRDRAGTRRALEQRRRAGALPGEHGRARARPGLPAAAPGRRRSRSRRA